MGVWTRIRTALLDAPAELDYPLSLPGRLEFLEERLGVSRETILQLAGAPPEFAADPAVAAATWEELVAQQAREHRDRLAAVEALLAERLAGFEHGA